MMKDPFELNDLNVSGFIGDVKIDLSKAMIPEGESTMTISGVIGNVDVRPAGYRSVRQFIGFYRRYEPARL